MHQFDSKFKIDNNIQIYSILYFLDINCYLFPSIKENLLNIV